jgi:hypothetical protein
MRLKAYKDADNNDQYFNRNYQPILFAEGVREAPQDHGASAAMACRLFMMS